MKTYGTEIKAIHPVTGKLTLWVGPNVEAENREQAQRILNETGRGYCKILDPIIASIDAVMLNLN